MRTFRFEPGYYEWHLIDCATEKTVHNLVEPSEDLYNEDGTPMTKEELADFFASDIQCANMHYSDNEDYNGILLDEPLDDAEIAVASKLIADTLYNYYIA